MAKGYKINERNLYLFVNARGYAEGRRGGNVQAKVEEIGKRVADQAVVNAPLGGTGELKQGISSGQGQFLGGSRGVVVRSEAPHSGYVQYGTRPTTKQLPVHQFVTWGKAINAGAVAHTVGQNGLKANPFFTDAIFTVLNQYGSFKWTR